MKSKYLRRMQKLISLIVSILLMLAIPASAQEPTEGRITEHNVVSIVALGGLLTVAHFVRKGRRKHITEEMNTLE